MFRGTFMAVSWSFTGGLPSPSIGFHGSIIVDFREIPSPFHGIWCAFITLFFLHGLTWQVHDSFIAFRSTFMGLSWALRGPLVGFYGLLWQFSGILEGCMGFISIRGSFMEYNSLSWQSHGISWTFVVVSCDFTGFRGISIIFEAVSWDFTVVFHGIP